MKRSLIQLSTQINKEHELALIHVVKALEHANKAGELLIQAKATCKHGEWERWLENNFKGSKRQAQRYMRIHQHWPEIEGKTTRVSDLSLREGLKLLEGPKKSEDTGIENLDPATRIQLSWIKELYGLAPGVELNPGGKPGLKLPEDLSFEAWQQVGVLLRAAPFHSPQES